MGEERAESKMPGYNLWKGVIEFGGEVKRQALIRFHYEYESVVELWKSMKNAWLLPEKWPNEWMNMTKNVHKF